LGERTVGAITIERDARSAAMPNDNEKAEVMTLSLRALDGGAYTHLSLAGPMATVAQGKELRRLFALLSYWHGGPVEVVLCVGTDTAGWLEVWSDALCAVPARELRVQYLINRSTLLGGDGDG
jgi:hypothetical protein